MSYDRARLEAVMKRCRAGTPSGYNVSNDLHADSYGAIGAALEQIRKLEAAVAAGVEMRDAFYALARALDYCAKTGNEPSVKRILSRFELETALKGISDGHAERFNQTVKAAGLSTEWTPPNV